MAKELIEQEFLWSGVPGFQDYFGYIHVRERRANCSPREVANLCFFQDWPRQTKPKKGQFMNFSQGHSGTKVQCESCLFSQGKTPEFTQKWAKFMNFSFWPFLWFGLPGRLLILCSFYIKGFESNCQEWFTTNPGGRVLLGCFRGHLTWSTPFFGPDALKALMTLNWRSMAANRQL